MGSIISISRRPKTLPNRYAKRRARPGASSTFVSIRGITGSGFALEATTRSKIRQARRSSTVPVVLGFGIRSAADARAAVDLAGGFIVGTGAVSALGSGGLDGFGRYLESLFAEA
ncbi:MAG: tryptophan synthase subunit alpha [Spirochaetota bacterium]